MPNCPVCKVEYKKTGDDIIYCPECRKTKENIDLDQIIIKKEMGKRYQDRLVKLLKHFKKDSEIHYTYVIRKSLEIWYNSVKDIFYIGYQMGLDRTIIPFEAVESWVNSLETKNENL